MLFRLDSCYRILFRRMPSENLWVGFARVNTTKWIIHSDSVRTGKNSRFRIFKGAIRIFVPPKNEGIVFILPEMSKEMRGGFFLNLLSHPVCRQAGFTQLTLRLCLREASAKRCAPLVVLFFCAKAQRVTRKFSLTIRITGVEECDARDGEE